jgi:putative tryptophan/tyrosine transport system substrate-binding protein
VLALLVNPTNPIHIAATKDLQSAAGALGLQLHVLTASTERDFDPVFAKVVELRACLVIASDTILANRSEQLAALAVRHAVPAVHQSPEFARAGGLMSSEAVPVKPVVRPGSMRATSSRARSPPTYRFSKSRKSSWSSI